MKSAFRLALLATVLVTLSSFAFAASARLNFVLILADDLGWTDLHCYGGDLYQTRTSIASRARDEVHAELLRLHGLFPHSGGLLTGKYPARLHLTDWIPGLPPENPKLPRAGLDQVPAAKRTDHCERLPSGGLCHGQHWQVAPRR